MVDIIGDLIVKVKNANRAGKATVSFPYSKMREAVLVTLEKEGYVKNITKKGKKVTKTIDAELVYADGVAKIQDVEQVSKYSRRIYQGASELKRVRTGFGSLVLTTPKGIMTDKDARKQNVGGEILFKIW